MSNIKWPKTVRILNGNDMYHGELHSPNNRRHCLVGQLNEEFCVNLFPEARYMVATAISELSKEQPNDISILCFNDNHRLRTNAQIWNRAMYLLGYTEGNPQSKPVVIKKATK